MPSRSGRRSDAFGAALELVLDLRAGEVMQHHLHHGELVQVGVEQRLDDHAARIVTSDHMCGRYALHANPDVIALQFGLQSVPDFTPSYNIAPAAQILVVRDRRAARARWGLRGKFVNLRAETVAREIPLERPRCLVPASGFYEWKSEAGASSHSTFRPANAPLLATRGGVGARHLLAHHHRAECSGRRGPRPHAASSCRGALRGWLHGDESLLFGRAGDRAGRPSGQHGGEPGGERFAAAD